VDSREWLLVEDFRDDRFIPSTKVDHLALGCLLDKAKMEHNASRNQGPPKLVNRTSPAW
jgi:hypothetical protein